MNIPYENRFVVAQDVWRHGSAEPGVLGVERNGFGF